MTAMTMPLDCDEFAAKLADYLDGELPDALRGAMDVHAATCAECGLLLSELDSLRIDAASLPRLEPSRDLWVGIAERIDTRVLPLDAPRAARMATMRRAWRHPAVAAAALVLVTAGITHMWTRHVYDAAATAPTVTAVKTATTTTEETAPTRTASVTPSQPAAETHIARGTESAAPRAATGSAAPRTPVVLASRRPSANRTMTSDAEPVYAREIVALRAIVRERRSQLDPRTVAVLEQSIAVIDSAIAQSRAALAKDPASGFLATQLNRSLEKKVELLRTAALLPART
jgi:hypothetical protein